eukprot:497429_1
MVKKFQTILSISVVSILCYVVVTFLMELHRLQTSISRAKRNKLTTHELKAKYITFQSFVNSLFCPLYHPFDIRKYSYMTQNIYDVQFANSTCEYENIPNQTFFILAERLSGWGMFSILDGHHIPMYTLSLGMQRKFLITLSDHTIQTYRYLPFSNGKKLNQKYCDRRAGRDCFFQPVSNCNIQQIRKILHIAQERNSLLVINDTFCNMACVNYSIDSLEKFQNFTDKYKVILYDRHFSAHCKLYSQAKTMNRVLTETVIKQNGYGNISYYEFDAMIFSVLFRLHNDIRYKINEIVTHSLKKYKWKSSNITVALPIRASDECYSLFRKGGEMRCSTVDDHIRAIKHFQDRNGLIDTIIVTSEDSNITREYKQLAKNVFVDLKWIFNDFDITPDSGNPKKWKTVLKTDEDYYDLLISILSSIKLQMHAKYYIVHHRSNFIHGIWRLASAMHCEVDKYRSDNNAVEDKRYCINFDAKANEQEYDKTCLREDRFGWKKVFGQFYKLENQIHGK